MHKHDIFSIDSDHIKMLSDTDFRELIARLAEAELAIVGQSPFAVRAGGNQDAADGGVDVFVQLSSAELGVFPRQFTAYQAKRKDMTPAEVMREIKPNDEPRALLLDLAKKNGAYILALASDLTETQYRRRLDALSTALTDVTGDDAIFCDILDARRISAWAQRFPSISLWIQEKSGQNLHGWRPFGHWSGSDHSFTLDVEHRAGGLFCNDCRIGDLELIGLMRKALRKSGTTLRLVGLSGVGKTRLAEALFDSSVGRDALSPALAVYCDYSEEPVPSPRELAQRLISEARTAVFIIDNCPPSVHRAVSQVITLGGATVSALTIEFDVRDDIPEDGDVIQLREMSDPSLGSLLCSQFPNLSHEQARHIVDMAGGNCRLAVALAKAHARGSSSTVLKDDELLQRLFFQRRTPDANLLRSAEALSLVYSLSMAGDEEAHAKSAFSTELNVLAGIAGRTVEDLYRDVAELKERKLIQSRGQWRALLPQALANRLAIRALQRIPPARAADLFNCPNGSRLEVSFGRRLSFLHDTAEARAVCTIWLERGGRLEDLSSLSAEGRALFWSIAPVGGQASLDAITRASNSHLAKSLFANATDLGRAGNALLAFAYQPETFNQAVETARAIVSRLWPSSESHSLAGQMFSAMYFASSPLTLASDDQRLGFLETLVRSREPSDRFCAYEALERAIIQKGPLPNIKFGAKDVGHAWKKHSGDDLKCFWTAIFDNCVEYVAGDDDLARKLKRLFAGKIYDLWNYDGPNDHLINAITRMRGTSFWLEGWAAVQTRLRRDHSQDVDALKTCAEALAPQSAIELARAVALHDKRDSVYQLELDTSDSALVRIAGESGAALCEDVDFLVDFSGKGGKLQQSFAFGLGSAARDPLRAFHTMAISFLSSKQIDGAPVLAAFLAGAATRNRSLVNDYLGTLCVDARLSAYVPILQAAVSLDSAAIARIEGLIDQGMSTLDCLDRAVFPRSLRNVHASSFARLLGRLARPGSLPVIGIRLLSLYAKACGHLMYYERPWGPFNKRPLPTPRRVPKVLRNAGRELLAHFPYSREHNLFEQHHMMRIANVCLRDDLQPEQARRIMSGLSNGQYTRSHEMAGPARAVIDAMLQFQTESTLDFLFANETAEKWRYILQGSFPGDVPIDALRRWADRDPGRRFPILAALVPVFINVQDHGSNDPIEKYSFRTIISPLATHLLEAAPDVEVIMKIYEHVLDLFTTDEDQPFERRRAALREWQSHPNPTISEWAIAVEPRLVTNSSRRWTPIGGDNQSFEEEI